MPKYKFFIFMLSIVFVITNCSKENKKVTPPADLSGTLFQPIPTTKSKVFFKNRIAPTIQNNSHTNDYLYSGGGVSVGDINNDGLQDLLFISNEANPELYLNQGGFTFKNITLKSGIKAPKGWSSGSNFVDINQDGLLDIYICRGGQFIKDKNLKHNLLFINNGDLTFTEKGKDYGLDDAGTSTQAAFFDYDKDGDLDAYVMNLPNFSLPITLSEVAKYRHNPPSPFNQFSDHLYKNMGNGKFQDVTQTSGISNYGHGLGISILDINNDNWPDIFISNDFEQQDFLYLNNQNGTFSEVAPDVFGHNSYFAMGVDAGDINNDGWVDIFEVEMAPEERVRSVKNMSSMDRNKFEKMLNVGLNPQYMRNSLHLNTGYGKFFSEIAQFSHVNKTDWSWGTIITDLDDDGYKDIFVANGIVKDIKDRDYAEKGNQLAKKNNGKLTLEDMAKIAPSTPIQNYAFKNNGDLTFSKKSTDWGFTYKGFSNSVVYGDLDNDGDLDVVINNINENPIIYRNTSRERGQNYINVKFEGNNGNKNGIGGAVKIHTKNGDQYQQLYTVHGFQSSSQNIIHFGLGDIEKIDEMEIIWPNNKVQILKNVDANQLLKVFSKNATQDYQIPVAAKKYFKDGKDIAKIYNQQKEVRFDDFNREILIPHKLSQMGPFASKGDVNGDQKDDLYIGGSAENSGKLYLSTSNNAYILKQVPAFEKDKGYEDMKSLFFDCDQDGDLDLYVVSGSNEFKDGSPKYQDRLYINDGKGNFSKSNKLPTITTSGSCVVASDFDKDGDLDLFVGGRIKPGKYPYHSKSMLLQNNKGRFKNITPKDPDFANLGMVTSAIWSDYDKDGDDDLLVVGEWMSIHVLQNNQGKFKDVSKSRGLDNTTGWWNKIIEWDFDKDGDMDYILGNIGLAHKFHASKEKPFQVFANDFDNSGNLDIVLAYKQKDATFPVRGRDCTSEQMPFITEKFPTFESFGTAQIDDIFDEKKLKSALHYEAQLFASVILENTGNAFQIKKLPARAQFSAINGMATYDIDKDGEKELLIVGNMFQTEAETSRADASSGVILKYNNGGFKVLDSNETGWFCPNDAKDLKVLKNDQPVFIVTNNDAPTDVFMLK